MLIFIGTLHLGLTPEDELIKIIEGFKPTQLLVEIHNDDIRNERIEEYPDEMKSIVNWATNKHIEVSGFDSKIQPMKEKVSEVDLKNLLNEQMAIIKKHNWKDFNSIQLENALKTKSWYKVIDEAKDKERELEMYDNIIRLADDSHITVVVTGSGHIPFFKVKISDAQFPLSSVKFKTR